MKVEWLKKTISCVTLAAFMMTSAGPSFSQMTQASVLPAPGQMVDVSEAFVPALLKGMKVYPADPLRFDFLLDTGNSNLESAALEQESTKLIRYFLASLTVPEEDLWVNLSPYEGDRIIPDNFSLTEIGRDLLAVDYILKQLTSSLMYPEKAMGSEVWKRIYALAYEKYGTTDIPFDTFNKVWIMPDEATVYVNGHTALITSSHLKVMLDTDYLAMKKNAGDPEIQDPKAEVRNISEQVIREVVLPEIEKEVNGGKNFSTLRQIFHAMILSTWFKRNMQKSLVGQAYTDKNKVSGIDLVEKEIKNNIWNQYVEAFKKGAFNYIKEEMDEGSKAIIPRKYFSGGYVNNAQAVKQKDVSNAEIVDMAERNRVGGESVVAVQLAPVMGKIVELNMQIDLNGPIDHAMSDAQLFKVSAMKELRIDAVVRDVFKRSGLDMNADYISFRKDMSKILNEILKESISRDDPKDAPFLRIAGKALREDSIAYYIEEFGKFGPRDIILLLQRLHTLSGDLALYGVKEQTMEEAFVLVFVRQSMFFSHALLYQIITQAGFAGTAWEAVNADRQASAWLARKQYRNILINMGGKRLVEVMPVIKAVTDAFDIDVLAIQKVFLQGIIYAQQSQSVIEFMSIEEQKKTIGSLGHELAQNFLRDLMLILMVSDLALNKWGRNVQEFTGRGADGIVLKVVTPEGSPRVLKFNFPTNGLSPEDFFRILKSVVLAIRGDGKSKRAGFVETFMTEIISLPWFDGNRMLVVVEENEFVVDGIPLRTMVSQDKPRADAILSVFEQFVSLHQFLDSWSFFNRDAQNLNNILVDTLGQEKLVDYGNILTMESYVEYLQKTRQGFNNLSFKEISERALEENKKDLVLALVRILTGVQFRFINGANDGQRMQAFMVERFGVDQALRLKPVMDVLLKASDDPAVKFAELAVKLMDVIGKIDRAQNDKKEASSTSQAKGTVDLAVAALDLPERPSAVDFAMGWGLGVLLDKFRRDVKGSAIKPQINEDYLTRVLVENGKNYNIELKRNGVILLEDVFQKYYEGWHSTLVKGDYGHWESLSGLWMELENISSKDAFAVASNWMVREFNKLSGKDSQQELAQLTIEATRFAQLVLAGKRGVSYDKDHPSMVHLLETAGHKWNCQAISDMTAVLLGLWGARGVSVVEVDVDSDGVQYPDRVQYPQNGTGHVANLVRVGTTVVYLDQGAPAVADRGRVYVIVNGKRTETPVEVGSIGSLHGAEGLTIDRIFELVKARNHLNVLFAKLHALPTEFNPSNFERVLSAFRSLKIAWQELSERVVDKREDPVLVRELDLTFNLNMNSMIKFIDSNLAILEGFALNVSSNKAASNDLNDLLKKHSDLITVGEGGHEYRIPSGSAPDLLKIIPVFLGELDEISKKYPLQSFEFTIKVQRLRDLLRRAEGMSMDIVKKHSVNDKINSFIREYNLNQQDESFLNELRNKIEVFVKKEKQIFLSDEQLVTRVQRLYTAAGGNVNALDLAMSIQDQASDVGGIDLNSHQLRLNETGGKINFNGPIDPAMLAEINGFSPVVLSITPMSDPKAFFGAVQ